MSVITIEEAKLHQRIDHDDEDLDIQSKLDAAESMVAQFLGRYFYNDETARLSAFNQIEEIQERFATEQQALQNLIEFDESLYSGLVKQKRRDADSVISMTVNGIIFNSQIRAGILLTFGYLYETREDIEDLPQSAKNVIQPYRIGLGV
ncbi:head-tail connector protein [Acinetobacter bereziniae]|uniref:head-tail connector protein n=1 Tax=Acinetobacter bereziniae TaxID=106648 RepID=UPI0015DA32C3|nr:head-tail connector protein [Acinetobacter bereziniae]